MAYTTIAEVRSSTGFSNATNISDAVITAYIADADSIINSEIADIYTLPLASTPEIIETISRNIVIGLLYANEYGEETENLDKGWKKRMDFWLDILKSIKKGELRLYGTGNTELTRSSLNTPLFAPNDTDSASGEDAEPFFTMKQTF